jgi:hypothetical protein
MIIARLRWVSAKRPNTVHHRAWFGLRRLCYLSPLIAMDIAPVLLEPQTTLVPQITLNPLVVLLPHTTELPQITDCPDVFVPPNHGRAPDKGAAPDHRRTVADVDASGSRIINGGRR